MRKKRYNWPPIEKEFAAGQLSVSEISRRFGPSRKAILNHMGDYGVIYGSLAETVRRKVDAKLVTGRVTGKVTGAEALAAVEQAADRGAEIIWTHRKDIERQIELKNKCEQVLERIIDSIPKDRKISLDYIGGAKALVNAVDSVVRTSERLIKLQRQAFNLDEKPDSGQGGGPRDDLPPALERMLEKPEEYMIYR